MAMSIHYKNNPKKKRILNTLVDLRNNQMTCVFLKIIDLNLLVSISQHYANHKK